MRRLIVCVLWLGSLSACLTDPGGVDFSTQLKKDVAIIDAYLTQNSIDAIQDPSGLRYIVTTPGSGAKPTADSKISVKFVGRYIPSNDVFTQTTDGAMLKLNTLMAGWKIGVPLMNKGSKFNLYIPSGLAYGSAGNGSVPANANLMFEIELLDDDAQLIADVSAIDDYLANTLHLPADTIHKDPSGLRYVYSVKGTGVKPQNNGIVNLIYTGKTLPDLSVFVDQKTAAQVTISENILTGLQIGLVLIPVGSEVSMYLPSGLAYGPGSSPSGTVHPNTNVVFELKLISTN